VAAGAFLPKPTLTPDDLHRLAETADRYGQEVFPPDYFNQ